MAQIIEKVMKKKSSKIEQVEKFGDLNPRYLEI